MKGGGGIGCGVGMGVLEYRSRYRMTLDYGIIILPQMSRTQPSVKLAHNAKTCELQILLSGTSSDTAGRPPANITALLPLLLFLPTFKYLMEITPLKATFFG